MQEGHRRRWRQGRASRDRQAEVRGCKDRRQVWVDQASPVLVFLVDRLLASRAEVDLRLASHRQGSSLLLVVAAFHLQASQAGERCRRPMNAQVETRPDTKRMAQRTNNTQQCPHRAPEGRLSLVT